MPVPPDFSEQSLDAIDWLTANVDALKALLPNGGTTAVRTTPRTAASPQASRGLNDPQLQNLVCALVKVDGDADQTVFGHGVYWGWAYTPRPWKFTSTINATSTLESSPTKRRCLVVNHAEDGSTTGWKLTDSISGASAVPLLFGMFFGVGGDDDGNPLPVFHVYHIRTKACT